MNLELLESFGQNYPEENDGTLDCMSVAITLNFNRFGTLLAVGCNDGRIIVWDFLTRGIAKILQAHVHPVCSISWSRSGRKLVSASTDNNVGVWDVLSGECDTKLRFPSPVLRVQFHPRREQEVLVCPMKHAPVVVNLADNSHVVLPLEDESDTQVVAAYDHRGKHIYSGNSRGRILVVKADADAKRVAQFKVSQQASSNTAIKSLEFSRRGKSFLVNTADRVIRVYKTSDVMDCKDGKDPEPDQKLQDQVNKTMWRKTCFSGDGEFVCAGSARQHALYIWEKATGTLIKILHGTKGEMLNDVVWHPCRPIVASISQGVVTVWAQQQVENWSAFAPDFKELDENVDYEERESEFDLEDEDKSVQLNEEERVDDVEVDVAKNAPIPAFCSSDEEEEDPNSLLYLPIAPEIEEPEEHWVPGVDGPGAGPSDEAGAAGAGSKRGAGEAKENASPSKKKRTKTTDISLPDAPKDEVHPMCAKARDKPGGAGKRPMGRPKAKDKAKGK